MLLKSLELQGFKSFPDKTKLQFNRGLTAVVGPNGSGKSNISDAVRWVLGEQSTKTLRGAKMEDVIFLGTQNRKSLGFAQVSLTIDNSDHQLPVESDEVTITRRYYRSGDSEYKINGANVRLKDINELFMDTGLGKDGYSMIGQGKIAEIVGAKSGERREIFEEASGISKFRYRKTESERKLKAAEENLMRLKDILSELEARVGPLKTQSEKARQFLELSDKRRTLEISLWVDTLDRSKEAMRAHADKQALCQQDYDAIEAEIESMEQQTAQVYQKMQACLTAIDELRRKREELEGQSAQKTADIAVLENDLVHNGENIARIDGEIETFRVNAGDFDRQIADRQAEATDKQAQIDVLTRELVDKQDELLHLSRQSDELGAAAAQVNEQINRLTLEQTEANMTISAAQNTAKELSQSAAAMEAELALHRENLVKTREEAASVQEGLAVLAERMEQLQNALRGYELKAQSRRQKLDAAREEARAGELAVKEQLQKAKLLEDLEQNMEGFAYSVKSVVKQAKAGALRGVLGTVSQLIQVDKAYSVAVETALGGSMQHLVVENENTAKAAIGFLKEQRAGRATFLPLTSVKGSELQEPGLEQEDGFVSLASRLVQADQRYQGIIHSLLGRVAVAEDLDAAVRIARQYRYKFRIVTLDGQVVNAGGSLTGGSQNKNQGLLSRKNEIEALRARAKTLTEAQNERAGKLDELTREVSGLEANITAVKSEMTVVNEDRVRFEGEQKRLQQLAAQGEARLAAMEREIASAKERIGAQAQREQESSARLDELEQELAALQKKLYEAQGSTGDLSSKREELSRQISEKRLNQTVLEKDLDMLRQTVEELRRRGEDAGQRTSQLEEQRQALSEKNEQIAGAIQDIKQQIETLRQESQHTADEIVRVSQEREELEASTSGIRNAQKEKIARRETVSRELAKLDEQKVSMQKEYDNIITKMWEEYQMTRSEAAQIAVELPDLITARRDLNEIKNKIKSLGSVNVAAIEEYKEVSERYEFLLEQVGDVERSREELIRLIRDLTQQMQEIFVENFQEINRHFGRIFVELFGGGKAELRLTDEENVLECGIEIYVQPPGKIIKNLAALSGGEQAFVAIAIYFAILKVRPAPFCILDEIEAALDDVNVVKYADYLRLMSDKTQFILITHRRGSMEEADVLYGVTMQEEGVSKLLELKVSEIEQKLGMKQE